MKHVIITGIMGFTQKTHEQSGVGDLLKEARELHHDDNCCVELYLLNWKANVKGHAANMKQWYPDATHVAIGYSYGGQTLAKYARAMKREGMSIAFAALIDPVARRFDRWKYIRVLSTVLVPWAKIKIANSVKSAIMFYQRNVKPDGDKTIWQGTPESVPSLQIDATHNSIDDHPRVHSIILSRIRQLL